MDVLIPKAAELQRVDAELGQVERMIESGNSSAGGECPACGALYARGAAFCAQCAQPLTA
jgi:predicted amidophosphoribosyltransferase